MPFVSGLTQTLRLARPPFKPIFQYGGRRVPGILANRAMNFAAALQVRYGERTMGFHGQGLVYRQARLGFFVNRIYRQIRLDSHAAPAA